MPSQEHERFEDFELHEQELAVLDHAVDPGIDWKGWSRSDARASSFDPFIAHFDGFITAAELKLHAIVFLLGALADRVAEETVEEQEGKLPFGIPKIAL